MTFIELHEPVPRDPPIPASWDNARIVNREFLELPVATKDISFWDVIARRCSRRHFGTLNRLVLSQLLWHTVKTRETARVRCGVRWQSRPYPSAGGVHPIDVLVVEPGAKAWLCSWYNPVAHSLDSPEICNPLGVGQLYSRANDVLPVEEGTVLWFVANIQLSTTMYSNPESLIWRDSGALLATFYLVAEALELACCALGANGTREIRDVLGLGEEFVGVGGCVIGNRDSVSRHRKIRLARAD